MPLPGRARRAVQSALLSHGWEGASSEAAAGALEPWAHHLTELAEDQIEALLRIAPKYGVDLLTGPDWALVSSTRSRLAALARSWSLPPELHPVALAIGTGLPADPPPVWRTGAGVLDLAAPLVFSVLPPGVVAQVAGEAIDWQALPAECGLLLGAANAAEALARLAAALEAALAAQLDPDRLAIDPAWQPGGPPLGLFRRFGRPLLCTTDDPVVAALARLQGAQLFRTSQVDRIRSAVMLVDQAGLNA